MRKYFIILTVIFSSTVVLAMGDKSTHDQACMSSENIRLKVKDLIFNVPRTQVPHIAYLHDDSNYMNGTPASRLCQLPEDAALEVLGFNLYTNPSKEYHLKTSNKDCSPSQIKISLGHTQSNVLIGAIPETLSEATIRAQCEKTRNHNACQGGYRYRGVDMSFHYYKTCYPLESWQHTTQAIKTYLDQIATQGE